MNFNDFKKLDCAGRSPQSSFVRLSKRANKLYLSQRVILDAALKPNDRVDLYYHDGVFALKKSSVGCLAIRKHGSGSSLCINSLAMRLEMAVHTSHVGVFNAWCEDDIVYFTEREDRIYEG